VLGQCTALAHLNLSEQMASKLSGDGGLELRGVVKPLVFFSRRFALAVDAMVRRLVLLLLCRLRVTVGHKTKNPWRGGLDEGV
jgi:hypothetical protein